MAFFWYMIFNLLSFSSLNETTNPDTLFIAPLKIPLSLSSTFGELRPDHFHSGIDIKTQGVTGKPVIAPSDGNVFWIMVSPAGYGRALNIRHPSGYSTVYGHLERFSPAIERYVKNEQYARKSFAVMLYPPQDLFRFKKGDTIAYSGNTGASGGPHLHFEIRRTENEIPMNPLLFGFRISDHIKPVLEKLIVYPIGKSTLINNQNAIQKIDLTGQDGKYFFAEDTRIRISGPAGFGIKAYDLLDDGNNRFAVSSYELRIDSVLRFRYLMNEFSFAETRYVNSHIDYERYLRENTYYERLFVMPNDRLSAYHDVIKNGIFSFNDGKTHRIELIATDANNNKSRVSFIVASVIPDSVRPSKRDNSGLIIMPYNRTNRFRAENISVTIPAGALYDTLFFSYKRNGGTPQMYSDVHYIHNKYTPLFKPYTLSIKPTVIPKGKESKMLIIQMSDDFRKSALTSKFTDGYLTAEVSSFGMFFAGIDTIPPSITANGLASQPDLTGRSELRIKITDDLSGIKSYEPLIDGKWALFDYDQKNNVLIYKFDPGRITKGVNHEILLRVIDNCDNMSEFKSSFVW